jgi:hypothetical protein
MIRILPGLDQPCFHLSVVLHIGPSLYCPLSLCLALLYLFIIFFQCFKDLSAFTSEAIHPDAFIGPLLVIVGSSRTVRIHQPTSVYVLNTPALYDQAPAIAVAWISPPPYPSSFRCPALFPLVCLYRFRPSGARRSVSRRSGRSKVRSLHPFTF